MERVMCSTRSNDSVRYIPSYSFASRWELAWRRAACLRSLFHNLDAKIAYVLYDCQSAHTVLDVLIELVTSWHVESREWCRNMRI